MISKESLKEAWAKLKKENPKLRIKNAADELGVSEVELVNTMNGVTRLTGNWEGIFKGIENLGYVMALTRNEHVVHERKGEYHKISFNDHVGLVLDPNIDLRIFPGRFAFAYAVPVQNPRGEMLSIQLFNKYGTAVHKIYLMNEEHVEDYHALVAQFKHEDQNSPLEVSREQPPADYGTTIHVNEDELLKEWAELKDTHDFYPLLRKHKVDRTHALT
ncbi:MAG: hypothetical protein MI700_06550, partial [Balneolales bacterium]|nr:hypothetical protein [Balneolales bacterium]